MPKLIKKMLAIKKIASLGVTVAYEKFGANKPPLKFGDVPLSAQDITEAWLTAVLCHETPGAEVEFMRVYGGSDGTSERRALKIIYNEAGQKAGLPTRLFTKVAASFESRLLLGLSGAAAGESLFYKHVRPLLNLRSPKAYYAAYDPKSYRSVVILDDLSAEGYTFPDPLDNPIARQDADDMVEQMAIYHAAMWDSPMLENELGPLKNCYEFQVAIDDAIGFNKRIDSGIKRAKDVIPSSIYKRRKEFCTTFMTSLKANLKGPQTLIHHDVHPGNWLRDADGRMGLYDWQVVTKGGWALDYCYAMTLALSIDDRRAWEHDLLKRYIQLLSDHGVTNPPTFDEAWLCYRQQIFHGAAFGLFTLGRSALQPKMQPDEYSLAMIKRFTHAMEDLDSLDSHS